MTLSTKDYDILQAILAMDAYNRGYNVGLQVPGAYQLGVAAVRNVGMAQQADIAAAICPAMMFGRRTGAC